MKERLDVGALLRQLHEAGVDYVLIGGLALNAWGVIRSTKDIDMCPSPDPENLQRLADLLRRLGVKQLGVGIEGFREPEMPFDPTRADDLAQGGNYRLATPTRCSGHHAIGSWRRRRKRLRDPRADAELKSSAASRRGGAGRRRRSRA